MGSSFLKNVQVIRPDRVFFATVAVLLLIVGILLAPGTLGAQEEAADPAAAQLRQGETLLRDGQFQEAVSAYRQAVQKSPGSAEARHGLGLALAGLNRYQESLVAFKEAVRLPPTWGRAYADLGG